MADIDTIGPGPYPNVLDIPTPPLQRTGIFVMFVFPAIATVVFGLRVYTRVSMHTVGVVFKLNYYGWRDEEVPEFDPSAGLWWNFFEQMCYNPVLALVKCSILVFLLRLGGQNNTVFRAIWALMAITIMHAIAVFFGALFQCVPIYASWHPEIRGEATCIDNSFHIVQSGLTILTDFLIMALPFWIFLRLRMSWADKIAVLSVFAVGLFVPIVAIIRLVNMYRILYLGERSRHYSIGYVWTAVEVNLAVISCSMPALRPLFARWLPRLFRSNAARSSEPPYGSYYGGSANVTVGGSNMKSGRRESHATNYRLKELHSSRKNARAEIRGDSPTGSEEEIMTYNGILRTTNVNISYEDAKRSDAGSSISR
ncbi:hypothetical protein S7711_01724 [Stachybotrys chartarum IBT 7711]|uniref:Rhodopsin domain-containing protein n=1 Tax=Stachybotrys chartarum (strain CBS 109288 / IBT 7711) TaxID=1280523 RepID=A0A084AVE4_STACB|nr:hypothetical protein S7711_01724 [Stachybotrys chartarum IBT 7711]KFA46032.1 hypothetical protein S40293_07472 [Stachybotrys chartarum IBT 40293]KFA76106.1 hypothetical protein S40288_00283 [Stachybotrys chartarum IBT 40288]